MKKLLAIGLLLFVLSAVVASCLGYEPEQMPEPTTIPETTEETHAVTLEPMEGYTMLQTVYLMMDKDWTEEEVFSLLDSSGLYYEHNYSGNGWLFIDVSTGPRSRKDGMELWDDDYIEITLNRVDGKVHLVENSKYTFARKDVKCLYAFDRGYTKEDAANATEAFWFIDYSGIKHGTIYDRTSTELSNRKETMDMGIAAPLQS